MEKKIGFREMVFVASMFFGMLFGAGNLIFPVSMGQKAGMETLLASLGFCITGVGLPLLSIVAMAVSKTSSMTDMARLVGKRFSYFFTTLLYLCIGPLFAIPRTAVVPFQVGIVPYLPKNAHKIMLFLFSLLFFGIVLVLSLKPGKLLTYVGKVLNPIFLLFLSVLLFTALIFPMGKMTAFPATAGYEGGSLLKGLFEGYNTMDVVGALAFGNILIQTIRTLQGENAVGEENRATERIPFVTMLSGAMAAGMMVVIYFAGHSRCTESCRVFRTGKRRRCFALGFYVLFQKLWRNIACRYYFLLLLKDCGRTDYFHGNGFCGNVSEESAIQGLCLSLHLLLLCDIECRIK